MKRKIIIISGPTAIGKSDLAVKLAKRFNGEVVGADSMQIYKGMNIGTGKITSKEADGIIHRLIDIINPDESYSAGKFVEDAEREIADVPSEKLPIVVGGTGLYINALINGMNLSGAEANLEIRNKWKGAVAEKGLDYVYGKLVEIDPKSAEKIQKTDEKRIIRALEIYETTGKLKSLTSTSGDCKFDYLFIILTAPRDLLYSRINARVQKMFDCGFIKEVSGLTDYDGCQSMQAIGYKQILECLKSGSVNNEQIGLLVEDVRKLSRNYAKRQLTFLRGIRSPRKCYIDFDKTDVAFDLVDCFLKEENLK